MADFAEGEIEEDAGQEIEKSKDPGVHSGPFVDFNNPLVVQYCPHCSMPQEYCQYGPLFKDRCLPHMQSSMSEEAVARALGQVSHEGGIVDVAGGGKKSRVVTKEVTALETKVIIARIQRQKKKFDTAVTGLETIAALKGKLEDAAKFFKKKFSCGASVNKTASGTLEVVIQGDVSLDLPERLIAEYKIAPNSIFYLDGKDALRCYA